jgi:hypothetical protein
MPQKPTKCETAHRRAAQGVKNFRSFGICLVCLRQKPRREAPVARSAEEIHAVSGSGRIPITPVQRTAPASFALSRVGMPRR